MDALPTSLPAPSTSARPTASESVPAAPISTGTGTAQPVTTAPHDDYGLQLALSVWLLALLSGTALALRIWCKHIRHKRLWWDDHFLVASWVRCIGARVFPGLSRCELTAAHPTGFPTLGRRAADRRGKPRVCHGLLTGRPDQDCWNPDYLQHGWVFHDPGSSVEQDIICAHAAPHHRRMDEEDHMGRHHHRQRDPFDQRSDTMVLVLAFVSDLGPRLPRHLPSTAGYQWI